MTNHQRLVPVCRKDIRESGTAVDDKVELRQVDSIVGRRITYLDIAKGGLYSPIKAADNLQPSFKDLAGVFDILELAALSSACTYDIPNDLVVIECRTTAINCSQWGYNLFAASFIRIIQRIRKQRTHVVDR